jgi:xanthine/uracil/vitamin C permease (AzgA family)
MEIISPSVFIWPALTGIAIGYGLRVFEYVVWSRMQYEDTASTFGFAMMIIAPSVVVGMSLGYVSLVLLTLVIKDSTALSFSAFLLSAFWAFLSLDLRDFLRRR